MIIWSCSIAGDKSPVCQTEPFPNFFPSALNFVAEIPAVFRLKYRTPRKTRGPGNSARHSRATATAATVDGSNLLNQFCDHVKRRFSAFTCYGIVTPSEQTLMQQRPLYVTIIIMAGRLHGRSFHRGFCGANGYYPRKQTAEFRFKLGGNWVKSASLGFVSVCQVWKVCLCLSQSD